MPDTQKLKKRLRRKTSLRHSPPCSYVPVLHGIADFRRTGVVAVYYELVVCYMVDIAFPVG